MKKISVVIPTLNEEKYIKETLRALETQTIPRNTFEIIIVDNNSSDNTLSLCEKADLIIKNKERVFISELRNQGAGKAKSKQLLFLDADVILKNDFLEQVIKSDYDFALPHYLRIGDGSRRLINWLNKLSQLITRGVNITPGCCMAFKQEVFKKNPFNTELSCNEDIELVNRVRRQHELNLINSTAIHNDRRFSKQSYLKCLNYSLKKIFNYLIHKKNLEPYKTIR